MLVDVPQGVIGIVLIIEMPIDHSCDFIVDEYPEIKRIKDTLYRLGCVSLMSGSGSCVFGLVEDVNKINYIINELKKYDWNVWVTNSVVSL